MYWAKLGIILNKIKITQMKEKDLPDKNQGEGNVERRQYIRLKAIFPVEFQFIDSETSGSVSDIKQGFTKDISKGGICLEANNIEEGLEALLKNQKVKIDLSIHIPVEAAETKAIANIAWYKKEKSGYPNKYLIGLSFLQIDSKERERIYSCAKRLAIIPKALGTALILFIVLSLYFYSNGFRLKIENEKLVEEMVDLSKKKSAIEEKIAKVSKEQKNIEKKLKENDGLIEDYKFRIQDLEKLPNSLEAQKKLVQYLNQDKLEAKKIIKKVLLDRAKFYRKVSELSRESLYLKSRISKISSIKSSSEDALKNLLSSFETIEDKNIASMYRWIKTNQNICTGLITSYESGKKGLEDWAFTYDQSLACQVFTLMGDQGNAKQVLEFYKNMAEKASGQFANNYDAYTGNMIEDEIHSGPNIWLGIAILHYTDKFKDEAYLSLAEDIGNWLIVLQGKDTESGIRGGPDDAWQITEHNIDAYAFFGMLYKITKDTRYKDAGDKVFSWIKKNAFIRKDVRVNKPKGDSTITSDTFAWAIPAIGPQKLTESGMDPVQIMDFAETNCVVTTDYRRPSGEVVKVTGFDFGKYSHLPRGGIVSTEWTAQMIISLKIVSEYFKNQNRFDETEYYRKKRDFYMSELEKMIIISPSKSGQGESCLPYATQDDADTGHGWRVQNAAKDGSIAGTAYTIFAKYNYNPLELE